MELNPPSEIERLYQANPIEEANMRDPPKIRYLPSDLYMKCMILK